MLGDPNISGGAGNGGAFALVKYGTFPYSGGWMSSTELDNIVETALTPNPASWSDITNFHDNNLSNWGYYNLYLTTYPRLKIDQGVIVGLDSFRIYQAYEIDSATDIWVYGSTTGVFGGEETLIATRSGIVGTAAWLEIDFTTYGIGPSAYRYWCIKGYRAASTKWRIYELGWRWQPSVVFANVPYGVTIKAYNNASALIESHRQENESWSEFVSFTDTTIDRIVIYEPDGVTEYYDTGAGWSWDQGDVWVFWNG